MQEWSINEITKSLRASEEDAFRFHFQACSESLEAFAQCYATDDQVSKDLVQEAFYNLWKKRTSPTEDVNIRAYLYQSFFKQVTLGGTNI